MKLKVQTYLPLLTTNTIFFLIGLILANALTFITFLILARGLSTSDFGIFDLFASISILINTFFAFGIDSAVGRYFHEIDNVDQQRKVVSEALVLQTIFMITIGASLFLMAEQFIGYLTTNEPFVTLLRLSIVQAAFQTILNFALSLLKWSFEKWKFIILSVASSGLSLCLTTIAIYGFNADLCGVFESVVVARVVLAAFGLYLIRNLLANYSIAFEFSGRLIRYAIPIGVVCVMEISVPTIERNFILELVGAEQLGQYSAAAKFVSILMVITQAFQAAWGPLSLSIRKLEVADQTYSLAVKVFVLSICLSALLMTYFGKFALILVASDRYEDAYILVFPMAMSVAIHSTGMILGLGIQISLRSHYQIISQGLFIIVAVILVRYLTIYFGIVGAAIAVLISIGIRTLTLSVLSEYAYPIKWPFRTICSTFFATLLIGSSLTFLLINFGQWISGAFVFFSILVMTYGSWHLSLSSNERLLLCALLRR